MMFLAFANVQANTVTSAPTPVAGAVTAVANGAVEKVEPAFASTKTPVKAVAFTFQV